jgi:hypothetical protein
MANLMKRTFTRYLDAEGRRVNKDCPGARKIKERSAKWYGKYRDADGKLQRAPLSPDKVAAQQMLAELVRKSERGKAGMKDPHEKQKAAPIEDQIQDYQAHLRNKGVSDKHLYENLRRLRAVLKGCGVEKLADLRIETVERFLAKMAGHRDDGPGSRTRNTYRGSVKAFSKWCHKTCRLSEDVLANLEAASGAIRRQRRAMPNSPSCCRRPRNVP